MILILTLNLILILVVIFALRVLLSMWLTKMSFIMILLRSGIRSGMMFPTLKVLILSDLGMLGAMVRSCVLTIEDPGLPLVELS